MENTVTAILAGLGSMLLEAAVVAGLVWLAYRLAQPDSPSAVDQQASTGTPHAGRLRHELTELHD